MQMLWPRKALGGGHVQPREEKGLSENPRPGRPELKCPMEGGAASVFSLLRVYSQHIDPQLTLKNLVINEWMKECTDQGGLGMLLLLLN